MTSDKKVIENFKNKLEKSGINVTIRRNPKNFYRS